MAPTISTSSPPRRRAATGLAFLLYEAVALACYGRLPGADAIPGGGDDPQSFVWFLLWWPWAVLHGHDPLHTRLVFAPTGYGIGWATAVPTASLMALPVTLLAGPVVAYGWLVLLAPALNGAAMHALALELTRSRAAALLAGFLFAFSGYADGQLAGHLNLVLVFPLPLLCLAALRRVRGETSRGTFIALATLLLVAQFGLSTEIFADAVVCACLALCLFAFFLPRAARPRLLLLARDAAAALAVTVLLVSPLLIEMHRDAAGMPDFLNPPALYSNDLLNLVVPTPAERLRTAWTDRLAARFTGNVSEQDLYVGLPLLLILILHAARHRRAGTQGRAGAIALLAFCAAAILLSLGPVAHVAGRPTIPLPALILTRLPLLRGALPCRDAVFAALAASLAAALFFAERRAWYRWPLALAACATLVPGLPGHIWTGATAPCLFTAADIRARFGPDPTLLLLPYGSGRTMLWQASAGMSFRQIGGRLSFVPLSWQADPLTFPLLTSQPVPEAAIRAFARRHGATAIIAGPGAEAALPDASTVCGVRLAPAGPPPPPRSPR